jgi:hypothetical protein
MGRFLVRGKVLSATHTTGKTKTEGSSLAFFIFQDDIYQVVGYFLESIFLVAFLGGQGNDIIISVTLCRFMGYIVPDFNLGLLGVGLDYVIHLIRRYRHYNPPRQERSGNLSTYLIGNNAQNLRKFMNYF